MMLNRVANFLTDKLTKCANDEEREIYVYGWEMILSTICVVATILILSVVTGRFVSTVLYLACFFSIRSCAGGSHASTYLGCYITSLCFYLVPLLVAILFRQVENSFICAIMLGVAGALLVFIRAPQDHPNRRLTEREYPERKRKSRIFSFFWLTALLAAGLLLPSSFIPSVWWVSVGLAQAGLTLIKSE